MHPNEQSKINCEKIFFEKSYFQKIKINGKSLYLKRDDLIHQIFSGNKARKLFYYLTKNFSKKKEIISYGGAQSNMIYPLSELARIKKMQIHILY